LGTKSCGRSAATASPSVGASPASDATGATAAAPRPAEPQSDAPASPAPTTAAAPQPTRSSTAAEPAARGDWAVQLGSFGEEANARRLAERVTTFGYKPTISSVRSNGRVLHRVRVGPYATRNQAEAAASALKAHSLPAQVVAAN